MRRNSLCVRDCASGEGPTHARWSEIGSVELDGDSPPRRFNGDPQHRQTVFALYLDWRARSGIRKRIGPELHERTVSRQLRALVAEGRLVDSRIDWATWLKEAGVKGIKTTGGVKFDSATYAVEAAVHGEGVLLGRSALVSADLAAPPAGAPLRPRAEVAIEIRRGLSRKALRQRKVKAFRDWIFAEMRAPQTSPWADHPSRARASLP